MRYLLRQFIELRESGSIVLKKIAKPNLEQLARLIEGLLTVKSGGRIPAILATALFQTITECHSLGWNVEFQGINVADKSSGAVGDITIRKSGAIILGIEVTERPIDQARVTLTFNQKISPNSLADYLFITTSNPHKEATDAARSYTGVGHEMNFVLLAPWLTNNLATLGPVCRAMFQAKVIYGRQRRTHGSFFKRSQKTRSRLFWRRQNFKSSCLPCCSENANSSRLTRGFRRRILELRSHRSRISAWNSC